MDWIAVTLAILVAASGCGGGCGGCTTFEPIPGGFPAGKRNPNAVQVRVTQTGLAAIAADPAAILGSIGDAQNGVLNFNVPANCGGSTPVCCPGGVPKNPCGPIGIDLKTYPGDAPRLELKPAQNASRLDVTVRARVKTTSDIPVKVPVFGDCGIRIDTAGGNPDDIQIDAPIGFTQDATAGTTRVGVGTVNLANLSTDDVDLTGGFGCDLANLGLGFFLDVLKDQLTGAIGGAIQDQTCKACPSGNVSECGSFATACTNQTCMQGSQCLQELGLSGRARGTSLFGSLSPGTTGAIDLYEVAGGYATSNQSGLALGLLGGMLPAGGPRDRCGPPATAPTPTAIPISNFFQNNTRPDTGARFDVGIGVHKSQLEAFAYSGYDGGLLCLTITGGSIAQLSTDTLSLISRSLGKLVDANSPMAVGIRPQSPPTITLGKNTFMDDGAGGKKLVDPLLDLKFTSAELDFFASIDDQYVRVFTVVSDIHLPLGLQVTGMGEIAPVFGNTDDAFTNLSVKNSDAVTETPAELAALFPNVLALVLPQLSGGLPPISLPQLGGLSLSVTDITGVPVNSGGSDVSFLAIFANLVSPQMLNPVDTLVSLGEVREPERRIAADPKQWRGARAPTIQLDLGGDRDGLEWSWKIDGGTWSAWSASPRPTITSPTFWLAGTHHLEVRARERGKPETMDLTPAALSVELGPQARRSGAGNGFHGQPGEGGCDCATGGSPAGSLPLVLALGLIVLPLRRMRRYFGAAVLIAAIASLPGCSCSSDYCGGTECIEGDLEPALGRYTSLAGDKDRVLAATYDQAFGDLVVVDVTDPTKLDRWVVDGIPGEATPTHTEGSYRRGIEEPGADVGAYTSIAIADGRARIAYHDRDARTLRFAYENKTHDWDSYVVDEDGEDVGRYGSLVFDAQGNPAIAYIALGIDDGMGHRATELRIARARNKSPGQSDWTKHVVATQPGTCGGLCGVGEACVAGEMGEACVATTSDCTAACAADEACIGGSCTGQILESKVAQLATGTGLFVSLVVLPDGRLAAAYYDQKARALMLAVENAASANEFTESVLHGGMSGDRGLWTSAVVDGGGTIHIAYQDAIGDQVMYVSWNGSASQPELVDDGQRTGDRTHTVGGGAAIYLVGGGPVIAYQDGMTADVYLATKGGASWTQSALVTGPTLDGFSIGATTGHDDKPYLAWGRIDPVAAVNRELYVDQP